MIGGIGGVALSCPLVRNRFLKSLFVLVFLVAGQTRLCSDGKADVARRDSFSLSQSDLSNLYHRPSFTYGLAPPSIFQSSFPSERTEEFSRIPLSDIKFLTAVFSIAYHFLVDGRTEDTLVKTINDKFRADPSFLEGIHVSRAYFSEGIVFVPCEIRGKDFLACIGPAGMIKPRGYGITWGESPNLSIQLVPSLAVEEPGKTTPEMISSRAYREEVTVTLVSGLDIRAASAISRAARDLRDSDLTIVYGNKNIAAENIYGLISLGVRSGEKVTVYASGPSGKAAVEAITSRVLQEELRGKGKHSDCFLEIAFNPFLADKPDISMPELLKARRPWKRSTVQLEVRMLRLLGLLDRGPRRNTVTLAPVIAKLPDNVRYMAVQDIAEYLDTQPARIPADALLGVSHELEKIILRNLSRIDVLKKAKELKTSPVVFSFPDLSRFSLKGILEKALTIEEYYYGGGECSRFVNDGIQSYFMRGAGVITKKPDNELRLITHQEVKDPSGARSGDLLIYFDRDENAVTLALYGANRNMPAPSDNDIRRGEKGWDEAVIKVYLDEGYGISMIHHKTSEMGLSRATVSIMLEDAGVHEEFPQLFIPVKEYLVLQDVTPTMRLREKVDDSVVRLKAIDNMISGGEKISEKGIRMLEDMFFYKSRSVREIARSKLDALFVSGYIDDERMEQNEALLEVYHMEEDILFIKRELLHDHRLMGDITEKLFGRRIEKDEVRQLKLDWYGGGRNKNVYLACAELKNGDKTRFAISTIRNDPLGGGFSEKAIDDIQGRWKKLSEEGKRSVASFGANIWARDFRPRRSDMVVHPEADAAGDVDWCYWIRNDISIVFREFVEGRDLDEIIADENIPEDAVRMAVRKAVQGYLDLWNETRDDRGGGLFIGDPKPANIVLSGEGNDFTTARIIDLDALEKVDSLEDVIRVLSNYPEYEGIKVRLEGNRAVAKYDEKDTAFKRREKRGFSAADLAASLYADEGIRSGRDFEPREVFHRVAAGSYSEFENAVKLLNKTGFLRQGLVGGTMRLNRSFRRATFSNYGSTGIVSVLEDVESPGQGVEDLRAALEIYLIHELNMGLHASMPRGRSTFYLIHEDIIPVSMRNEFTRVIQKIRKDYPYIREHVRVINDRHLSTGIYAFLEKAGYDPDKKDVFMASPTRQALIDSGAEGIVFDGRAEDEFRHMEGIIAALRALALRDIQILVELYELLTGKPFKGSEQDLVGGNVVFEFRPLERLDRVIDLKARLWSCIVRSA